MFSRRRNWSSSFERRIRGWNRSASGFERQIYERRDEIIFENHFNILSDDDEEVQQSLQDLHIVNHSRFFINYKKFKNVDQICVYKQLNDSFRTYFIVEYKPAHKMSEFDLRVGFLRTSNGSMNIMKDLINKIIISNDFNEKFIYNSERLMTVILIQIYGYIMKNGFEFSYLITGKAFIYLWINEREPHNLYYYLAEPKNEAEKEGEIL